MIKRVLILIPFFIYSFSALGSAEVKESYWEKPEAQEEHGPFYTNSLLGFVVQGGNTIDNTIIFSTTNSYLFDFEILQLGGHYNYGWDEAGLSSRNWHLLFRYQRAIIKSFSLFGSIVVEGDPFAGFNDRLNYDLGINFPFKGKVFSWDVDVGYRYTEESPTQEPERYQNKLRFHLGGDWKIGKSGEIKIWARYLPFLSDTQGDLRNFMLDFGASVSSTFTENFYLNLSLIGNHREVPLEDRKQHDYKMIGSVGFKI